MKKDYQLVRGGFHFSWAIGLILLVQIFQVRGTILSWVVFGVSTVVVLAEILRVEIHKAVALRHPYVTPGFLQVFCEKWTGLEEWGVRSGLARNSELSKHSGITSYMLGIDAIYFLLVHGFKMHVMFPFMAGIILASGDPVARIMGIYFNGAKISERFSSTWIGSIFFVITSMGMLLVTQVIGIWHPLYIFENESYMLLELFLVGSLAGAVVEAVVPRFDNFFIPLVSGIAMSVFYTFY